MDFDFSTSGTVDSLDAVPEHFRSVYQQAEGGKFVVNPALQGIVDAVTGLNKALKSERTLTGQLKGQKDVAASVQEALGSLGIKSLDEAKAKITELTELVAQNSKVDPKKIKEEIEATFAGERDGYKQRISKMESTLERYLVDAEANAQLASAKGNVKLLLPVIKQVTKVVADGEDYVVRVLDADGQYRGDGKGGFMTVADLVNELKNSRDYAVAFASDSPSGGGQQRQPQPSRHVQQQQQQRDAAADRSPQDMISAGLKARRGR